MTIEMHHELETDMFCLQQRAHTAGAHGSVTHVGHRLSFITGGEIELHSGSPLTLGPGAMMVLPAGQPHRRIRSEGVEFWMLGFCGACLDLHEDQLLMQTFHRVRRGAMPVVTVAAERRAGLEGRFADLQEELQRGAPESPELCRALLLLILGELRRCDSGPQLQAPADSLVANALEFMQRKALHPISLRDVAAAVHRSPAHVATCVKKATGFTVGDWLRSLRVAEAAAWLAHSDASLDEIAERVGWQDKTHLIRQFRKENGVTPAAWRRAHRAARQPTIRQPTI